MFLVLEDSKCSNKHPGLLCITIQRSKKQQQKNTQTNKQTNKKLAKVASIVERQLQLTICTTTNYSRGSSDI